MTNQDPVAVRRWLKQTCPAIQWDAKATGAQILWGDEMRVRSDRQAGTSWGLRGKTPIVAGTGQRFGCNMISAISNRGQLWFMVFERRFTAAVFLALLRRLRRQQR